MLLLGLDFLESYDHDLKRMNRRKVGRPYMLTERYVQFLCVVRHFLVFLVGSLRASFALSLLVPRLPSTDYASLRRVILNSDVSLYTPLRLLNEPVIWLWTRLVFVCIRVVDGFDGNIERRTVHQDSNGALDVETKETLATILTTDGIRTLLPSNKAPSEPVDSRLRFPL